MTTTEVQAATEVPVADAPVEKVAPKKVERVKRMEKPDRRVMDEQIAKLQAQQDSCHNRIQEIKNIIESKKDGRKNGSAASQAARARLNELRAASKAALDAKAAIRIELAAVDSARDKLREETKSIKDKLSFVKVEQIDDEIGKLEARISHTTMTIDEERKTVEQIKQLRKSRENVKLYNDRLEKLQGDDSMRRAIIERIKEQDIVINDCKAREAAQKQVLDGIRAKEDAQVADIPALANERNESYEIIREAREAVRNLRAQFKQKEDEYYANERLWRAQQAEEKKRMWEANQAERDERAARRKAWEAENAPEPFDKEVVACEQLMAYMRKYTVEAVATPAADASVSEPKQLDGMTALKRDDINDFDVMFAGMGGGKKKGGGKGKKSAKVEVLTHSLDIIASYGLLKLSPPSTKEAAAGSLEELKEKKEHFLKKRVEAVEKKKRDAEAEANAPKDANGQPAGAAKGKKGKRERRGRPLVTVTLTVTDDAVEVTLTVPEKKPKEAEATEAAEAQA